MGNTTSGSTKSTEETKVFNLVVDTLHLKFDEATGQFTERDDDNKNNDDATGIVMFGRDPMIKYLSSINDPASFEKFVAEITKYSNGDENVSGVGISAYVDKLQLDFNRSMVVLLDTTKDDQLTDITISDTKKQSPTSIASEIAKMDELFELYMGVSDKLYTQQGKYFSQLKALKGLDESGEGIFKRNTGAIDPFKMIYIPEAREMADITKIYKLSDAPTESTTYFKSAQNALKAVSNGVMNVVKNRMIPTNNEQQVNEQQVNEQQVNEQQVGGQLNQLVKYDM